MNEDVNTAFAAQLCPAATPKPFPLDVLLKFFRMSDLTALDRCGEIIIHSEDEGVRVVNCPTSTLGELW